MLKKVAMVYDTMVEGIRAACEDAKVEGIG